MKPRTRVKWQLKQEDNIYVLSCLRFTFFSTKLNFKMGNSEVTVRGKFDVKKLWQRWIYFIYIHVCITVWIFNSFFEAWLTLSLTQKLTGSKRRANNIFETIKCIYNKKVEILTIFSLLFVAEIPFFILSSAFSSWKCYQYSRINTIQLNLKITRECLL